MTTKEKFQRLLEEVSNAATLAEEVAAETGLDEIANEVGYALTRLKFLYEKAEKANFQFPFCSSCAYPSPDAPGSPVEYAITPADAILVLRHATFGLFQIPLCAACLEKFSIPPSSEIEGVIPIQRQQEG